MNAISETPGSAGGAFAAAFEVMGGAEALAAWGRANPEAFYALFAKACPGPAGQTPAYADVSREPLTEAEWSRRMQANR